MLKARWICLGVSIDPTDSADKVSAMTAEGVAGARLLAGESQRPLGASWSVMKGDPTTRRGHDALWHASWTPEGPATIAFLTRPAGMLVQTYGPGGQFALDRAESLMGAEDDGSWAAGTSLEKARHRHGPVRIATMFSVADTLLRIVFGQRVTHTEAADGYRKLVYEHGQRAPGPRDDLWLPPRGRTLSRIPYYDYHLYGVERKRALTMQELGKREVYLEGCAGLDYDEVRTRLRRIRGIGPWTAELMCADLGDGDAVPVGDYHLPNLVSWALAREERGNDARMLELLEGFRPERGRAIRILAKTVGHAPRRGAKNAPSRWTLDERY